MKVRFVSCGDAALSVELGDAIDRELSMRVLAAKAAIEAAAPEGTVEIVPSYRSLLIHFDPLRTDQHRLEAGVERILDQMPPDAAAPGREWRIPCCYEPEFAPDMANVADATGLSADRIVHLHSKTVHYVYMLGFAPGQPYLGDLPAELALPRRAEPIMRIEEGSVVTATGLTVIYPIANPTGWHVIGRTPLSIFDINRDPPALLRPGDRIMFEPIGASEFRALEKEQGGRRQPRSRDIR